jgi:uncharacterized protein (TIGR02466 family)
MKILHAPIIEKCTDDYQIENMFPLPMYTTKRDSDLDSTEEKEIEDIIEAGLYKEGNWTTHNTYIFNDKLKKIKQFCEKHINIYVKEVLNPLKETNYFITQSWLNVTNPGEFHHLHSHSNSIISGVFYISTEVSDTIVYMDPNEKEKSPQSIPKGYNIWNTPDWSFPVENNNLILFPSWLSHYVPGNKSARSNGPRITIAFNTFAKGIFGNTKRRNELILS